MRPGPAALLALTTMLIASEAAAQEAADGERLFRQRCSQCHALEAGAAKAGPHLDGIIGRKAGSVEGARYSRALPQSQIIWDDATLDSFLANPRKLVVGTTMMVGVPNEAQRKSIIAYLKMVPAAAN